jgi:hypothetical protein
LGATGVSLGIVTCSKWFITASWIGLMVVRGIGKENRRYGKFNFTRSSS